MFKNKLKLTKKLAMLAISAAVPFSILAANSHASAMNYPMLSKLLARKGSVPTAGIARRPVVQQPRVVEIAWHKFDDFDSVSDATLIGMAKSALAQNAKIKVSLTEMCRDGKFEFAKFLVENNLVDVNENLYSGGVYTPLSIVIETMGKYYNFDQFTFIKFLVDHGAQLYGGGMSPLIWRFTWIVNRSAESNIPAIAIPEMHAKLAKILDYLVKKGMNINALNGRCQTFLSWLMYNIEPSYRSSFYATVCDSVIANGGRSYV